MLCCQAGNAICDSSPNCNSCSMQHGVGKRQSGGKRGGERESKAEVEMESCTAIAWQVFEFGNESTNVLAFVTHTQRVAGDTTARVKEREV